MPFVHLRTDQKADVPTLRSALAAALQDALDKPPVRCMIQVETGAAIAMGDGTAGCAFIEIRVRGTAEPARVNACAVGMQQAVSHLLAIPPARVYINFLLITDTGVCGSIH